MTVSGGLLAWWWRGVWRRPAQAVLAILAVAVASATIVAIDGVTRTAWQQFESSLRATTGAATHRIVAVGDASLPESLYVALRRAGLRTAAPVVEGVLRVYDDDGFETRRVLGVDPFAEAGLRLPAAAIGADAVQRLWLRPGWVLVPGDDRFAAAEARGDTRDESRDTEPATMPVVVSALDAATVSSGDSSEPSGTRRWTLNAERLPATGTEAEAGAAGLWWVDLGTAQTLFDRDGVLSRIDVVLDATGDWTVARLERWLGEQAVILGHPGFRLEAIGAEALPAQALARAFRTNLLAMGLLAVLIAGFLLAHQQSFAVLRRRSEIADARLLGVTPVAIRWLVRGEALAIGTLGLAVGVLLALILVWALLGPLEATMATQFGVAGDGAHAVGSAALSSAWAWVAPGVLVAMALVAEPAARDAARIEGTRGGSLFLQEGRAPRWPWVGGWVLLVVGVVVLATLGAWAESVGDPSARTSVWATLAQAGLAVLERWFDVALAPLGGVPLLIGFGGLLALTIGGLLVGVTLLWALAGGVSRWRGRVAGASRVPLSGGLWWLALEDWRRAPRRGRPATMALALALAGALGVSVLVASFRVAVERWLDDALSSDVYLVPAHGAWVGETLMDLLAEVSALDGLVSVSRSATQRGQLRPLADAGGAARGDWHDISVFVVETHADAFARIDAVRPPVTRDAERFAALWLGDDGAAADPVVGVVVTETAAMRLALNPGDRVELRGPGWPAGEPVPLARVLAVIRDYASPEGRIWLAREVAARHGFDPDRAEALGLRFAPAVVETLREQDWRALATRFGPAFGAELVDPATIRSASMAQFDRTFAVTHALRTITVIVAMLAIVAALAAIELERQSDRALLRVLGLTPAGLAGFVLARGFWLGVAAGVLAVPLGFAMGAALIAVVNRLSFGWSMATHWPWTDAVLTVVWGLLAALLAAGALAWRRWVAARRGHEALIRDLQTAGGR